MLGVELVTDRRQKTSAKAQVLRAMEMMKGKLSVADEFLFLSPLSTNGSLMMSCCMLDEADMGVLVGQGGFYDNVLRKTPPLCFSKDDSGMPFFCCSI